jgi:Tol biopolymer transport system component
MSGPVVGRRAILGAGAGATTLGVAGLPRDRAASAAPLGSGSPMAVPLQQGTNIAVAIAPDGQTIAFDLLGLLWLVPAGGGTARCLTDAFGDLALPAWSPDGAKLVFQSYRSGNFHLWTINADGTGLQQRTTGFADHREPVFAPDGRSILFSSDRSGRYAIHLLDLETGAIRQLSGGSGQDSEPCIATDGRRFAYVSDGVRIMESGIDGAAARMVASVAPSADRLRPSELHGPAWAADGRLVYSRIAGGAVTLMAGDAPLLEADDLYPFRPSWGPDGGLYYAAAGHIRRLAGGRSTVIPFTAAATVSTPAYPRRQRDFTTTAPRPVVGIGSPMLSPDGRQLVFRALNDIYLLTVGNPKPCRLVSGPFYKCDPAWSPDGRRIVYSTDKGGTLDLWLHDLETGTERQLTHLVDNAALSATWSADGRLIAFLNQEGALHTLDMATGAVTQIYGPLWEPGRPSFGPDKRMIAYAAFKPRSARYREGLSEILLVDRETGAGRYQPIAADKSIGTRGDDGPVWSPDGRHMAYVFASTLWVQPVMADGSFAGPARQLTRETTDAPSWSGDGKMLLYLNNGRLKLLPLAGGAPRTIPLRLDWAIARPAGRTLIAGARLWDGIAPDYRAADVLVEGNRIAAVLPPDSATGADARRIEAAGKVLMPGLIDMHTHRQMQGYAYGDRMGRVLLAMGITATRSPGGPAYHMVEDREAIDAGLRVAPRHYATGEALDGSRIYYNFMRPITEPGQMALELERAQALSYDMVKTYVRMDHRTQAEVIAAAHRMGVHVSSHYHYPALRNGADCTEHLGATSRYGYSRTITALGAGYEDVNRLFAAARAGRTPTLFTAGVLLAEDPGMLDDPRIRLLFPPWEHRKMKARVHAMLDGDTAPLLAALERQVRQIRDMMALGWHVHTGTDAPIDLTAISLHMNLRAMVRFGISPFETLLTATRHAAAFLHEPIGTVEPGKLADMIIVDGDPLARIEDVAGIALVMANGVVHDQATLAAPFTAPSAIAPTPVRESNARHHPQFWETAAYVEEGRSACCAGHSVQV